MAMSDVAQLYFDLGTTYNNSFGPRQEAIDAFKMAIIILILFSPRFAPTRNISYNFYSGYYCTFSV